MQTEVFHLRVEEEVSGILKQQAQRCGMSATLFAVHLLRAGALAIKDQHGPIIPPRFEFQPGRAELNEKPVNYKGKK